MVSASTALSARCIGFENPPLRFPAVRSPQRSLGSRFAHRTAHVRAKPYGILYVCRELGRRLSPKQRS
jgi:hypothetical protein